MIVGRWVGSCDCWEGELDLEIAGWLFSIGLKVNWVFSPSTL